MSHFLIILEVMITRAYLLYCWTTRGFIEHSFVGYWWFYRADKQRCFPSRVDLPVWYIELEISRILREQHYTFHHAWGLYSHTLFVNLWGSGDFTSDSPNLLQISKHRFSERSFQPHGHFLYTLTYLHTNSHLRITGEVHLLFFPSM